MLDAKQSDVYKYFLSEMEYLRNRATEFSKDYPQIAHELRLSEGKSADPHIELLLQSFAFLSGSIRKDMDAEANQIPNQLLATLYPHLVAPIPSMTVLQLDVLPGAANFEGGWTLHRGREFYCHGKGSRGTQLRCRFRNTYNTLLRPLKIKEISAFSPNKFDFSTYPDSEKLRLAERFSLAQSVLKVHVVNKRKKEGEEGDPIREFGLNDLGFYINGHELQAYDLYSLLSNHLIDIAIKSDGDGRVRMMRDLAKGKDYIRWRGFEDDEAVLPYKDCSHKGYRLLQEYFTFPEKFLFFDLIGIDSSNINQQFELYFLFDNVGLNSLRLTKNSLRLNAVPVINVFTKTLEPIRLNYQDHEYRVYADIKNHHYCEVHSVEDVVASSEDSDPKVLSPYVGISKNFFAEENYYYSTRIEKSPLKNVPGTETYISFHDSAIDLESKPAEVISMKATCTNRRLPEFLRIGDKLLIEGAAPLAHGNIVLKPTRHQTPKIDGDQPWNLVSTLSLNYLSLNDRSVGLEALQKILHLYCSESTPYHYAQIKSLSRLNTNAVYERIGPDAWRGFCQGTRIKLEIDENIFEGTSPILFGEILRRFFALYASVNNFTQFNLESKQRKGIWKQWDPLVGEQIVL